MKKNMKKAARWGLISFSVMVLFLVGDCTKVDAASKAQYTYKTYDKSKPYKGKKSTIKDVEKYKRVILKGDSYADEKDQEPVGEKIFQRCIFSGWSGFHICR